MARVYRSAVIGAPISAVWDGVRDFNALPAWHPAIAKSEIEGGRPSDSIGCVRSFSLQDGGHLREQLLAMSDPDHSVTYSILVSPMPVANYVATLRLTPVTVGDQTFAEWWAEFDVTGDSTDAEMAATIGDGVFVGGFEALQRRFGPTGGRS